MKKRILPALLALAMVLTMLPMAVFAAEDNLTPDENGVVTVTTAASLRKAGLAGRKDITKIVLGEDITVNDETLPTDNNLLFGMKDSLKVTTILDMNGKNITLAKGKCISVAGNLTIVNSGSEGGVICGGVDQNSSSTVIEYTGNQSLTKVDGEYTTLKSALIIGAGVTVKSNTNVDGGYAIAVFPAKQGIAHGSITIGDGAVVEGYYGAVSVNGNVNATDASQRVIINVEEGATLTAKSDVGAGIYAAGYAQYNIEGKVEGASAIAVKSGELNISGSAELKATGEAKDPTSMGGGFMPSGAAISIDSRTGYAGDMKINVTGTPTLSSQNGNVIDEALPDTATPDDSKIVDVNVSGGTFEAAEGKEIFDIEAENSTANRTVEVSGGTFNAPVAAEHLADNLKVQGEKTDADGNTVYQYFETEDDMKDTDFTTGEDAPQYSNISAEFNADQGTVVAPVRVDAADKVTVTVTPKDNYTIGTVTLTKDGQEAEITAVVDQAGKYEFTPELGHDYVIKAEFVQKTAKVTFEAYVNDVLTFDVKVNGEAVTSSQHIGVGDTVTITVYPPEGTPVKKVPVTTNGSTDVDVTAVSQTVYTFVMPETDTVIGPVEFDDANETLTVENVKTDLKALNMAKVSITGMKKDRVYMIRLAATRGQDENSSILIVKNAESYDLYCKNGQTLTVSEFANEAALQPVNGVITSLIDIDHVARVRTF